MIKDLLSQRCPNFMWLHKPLVFLAWFLPHRYFVQSKISRNPTSRLKPLKNAFRPTINIKSRLEFELIATNAITPLTLLPQVIHSFINDLVSETTISCSFNIRYLDGCLQSKVFDNRFKDRANAKNFIEFGSLIKDLPDQKHLKGIRLVNNYLNDSELRLENGITLITDSWSKRIYWENDGGSHRMGVCCYELNTANEDYYLPATIREYSINLTAFDSVEQHYDVYVINSREYDDPLFVDSTTSKYDAMYKALGINTVRLSYTAKNLSNYELLFLDISSDHHGLAKALLSELCNQKKAELFRVWLSSMNDISWN